MPARTTIATLLGLTAGIALTLTALDEIPPHNVSAVRLITAAVLLPLGAVTLVAIHRLITRREDSTLKEATELDEALAASDALKAEHERCEQLEAELQEMYDQYNQLVLAVMHEQAGALGLPAGPSQPGGEPSAPSDLADPAQPLGPRRRKGHLALYIGGGVAAAVASLGTRARSAWRAHRGARIAVTATSVAAASTVSAAFFLTTAGETPVSEENKPSATAPQSTPQAADAPPPSSTNGPSVEQATPHTHPPAQARPTPRNTEAPANPVRPSTPPSPPPSTPPTTPGPSSCTELAEMITMCLAPTA